MERLKGKVAIVTGGASGIGKAIALRLARDGAAVVIADIQKFGEAAAEIAKATGPRDARIGSRCFIQEDVERMAAETSGRSAGSISWSTTPRSSARSSCGRSSEILVDEFRRVMEVNVMGVWLCCRACVPHMRKGGYGRIVNLASGAPLKGVPLFLHYISSKGAVIAMTRGLRARSAPTASR